MTEFQQHCTTASTNQISTQTQWYTDSSISFLPCVKYLMIHHPTENKQTKKPLDISIVLFELNQFILLGYGIWKRPKEKHAFN